MRTRTDRFFDELSGSLDKWIELNEPLIMLVFVLVLVLGAIIK